jgi:hypothetical protein
VEVAVEQNVGNKFLLFFIFYFSPVFTPPLGVRDKWIRSDFGVCGWVACWK